ncbi:MAG: hypothetical protein KDK97_09100 [Verrucomicrobiales bacterium]|nr:hypothetical protein [Verrucomicrobiales bacterium]MCP5556821.1 hypothetical protein [Verrucomicrobiaceae bacterium]
MPRSLSLALYNTLLPAGLLCMAPAALIKMRRRGGRWQDLKQRFGFYDKDKQRELATLPREDGLWWVHAVSVGEVNVAAKVIIGLLTRQQNAGIILSTTTPTGYQLASNLAKRYPGRVCAVYSLLDFKPVITRILDDIAPTHIVLVEAEAWPNLVSQARERGLPVSLVNARLSARSEARFRKFGWATRPIFSELSQVLVPEEEDIARWAGLGVPADRIHRTGSVKYDPAGSETDPAQLADLTKVLATAQMGPPRRLIVAASTHAGEEKEIAQVFIHLKKTRPDLGLLIVPRHVERAAAILADLRALGLDPALRSSQIFAPDKATDCLLVDTTGELRTWQALSHLVIIGKSFLAKGGQNPAEAALEGKPVLFGPNMQNFEPLVRLLLAPGGAVQVKDWTDLETKAAEVLDQPSHADEIGRAGKAALMQHHGATEATVERLLSGSAS